MEIKELYRYEREPGKVTVSTEKPEVEHAVMHRVIASDGYLVTQNGVDQYACIDTTDNQNWYEVEEPKEELEEAALSE